MKALVAALAAASLLTGCSAGGALSLLTGGGPNVAANVQAGKTNSQTIGQTSVVEQKLVRPTARNIEQSTGRTGVRSDRVESLTVNQVDPWLIGVLMLLSGFLIPSPGEIARYVRGMFSRKSRLRVSGCPAGA